MELKLPELGGEEFNVIDVLRDVAEGRIGKGALDADQARKLIPLVLSEPSLVMADKDTVWLTAEGWSLLQQVDPDFA